MRGHLGTAVSFFQPAALRAVTHNQHLQDLSTRSHLAWREALFLPTDWNHHTMLQVCEGDGPSQLGAHDQPLKRPSSSGNWAL